MLRLRLIHCAILIIFAVISPRLVEACGGFFCSTQPMNQLSERILFVDRGDSVTTHVQIQYSGSAADFAWILPVPSVPQLGVSHNEIFQQLQFATQPFFSLEWDKNGECGFVFPPFFRSFANLVQDEAIEVFILEKEKDFKYGQGKTIVAIAAGGKNAVGNEVKYVKWYNLYGGDADKTGHKLQPIDKTYTYGIDKARQFWDEKIQEGYDRVK